MAELLFMHVAPCIDESPTLESVVAAQVHDMPNGSTVVAKVCCAFSHFHLDEVSLHSMVNPCPCTTHIDSDLTENSTEPTSQQHLLTCKLAR